MFMKSLWIWFVQALFVTLLAGLIYFGITKFNQNPGDTTLWIAAIGFYWWLSATVILPWNIYFKAKEALEVVRQKENEKIAVDQADKKYAQTAKVRALCIALSIHVASAVAIFGIAQHYQFGMVGYVATIVALLTTGFRPAASAFEYTAKRLTEIGKTAAYPKDDVAELKIRIRELEGYDEMAKEIQKDYKETIQGLRKTFVDQQTASEITLGKVEGLEAFVTQVTDTLRQEVKEAISSVSEATKTVSAIDTLRGEGDVTVTFPKLPKEPIIISGEPSSNAPTKKTRKNTPNT